MDRFFNTVKIFVTGLFLCGIVLIGGKASAAEANQEAIDMLRETLTNVTEQNDLVFHQEVFFSVPKFTGKLEFRTITEHGTYKVKGLLDLFMVDDNGKDENNEYPFYITEDKKDSILYYKDGKKWKKWTSPVSVSQVNEGKTEAEEVEEIMSFVKDVTVLQDSDKQRTLLVKFDGEKVADAISKLAEELKAEHEKENPAEENKMNNEIYAEVMNCLTTGIKNADFWFTWTVDKTIWKTTTASLNLSGLVQSIAISALNNPFIESNENLREMFETMAFYSELKAYTTFLNPTTKEKLEIPKEVLKAKESKIFDDEEANNKE